MMDWTGLKDFHFSAHSLITWSIIGGIAFLVYLRKLAKCAIRNNRKFFARLNKLEAVMKKEIEQDEELPEEYKQLEEEE